jgi:hypothetical protein
MIRRLRRLLIHDWLILILVVVNLVAIGLYLGVGPSTIEGAGYRVIDFKAVRRLMDSGELSSHEATWYQQKAVTEKDK